MSVYQNYTTRSIIYKTGLILIANVKRLRNKEKKHGIIGEREKSEEVARIYY